MVTESLGVVRVARQVLSTIVINAALQTAGVVRMARVGDHRARFIGKELPKLGIYPSHQRRFASTATQSGGTSGEGVALTIKDNTVSADLYIVVASGVNIVEVGAAVQEEVASAIEDMIGMQVREVNVYIQDVA